MRTNHDQIPSPAESITEPCAVCISVSDPRAFAIPHACRVTLTQPGFIAGPYAFPRAFTRALRDA